MNTFKTKFNEKLFNLPWHKELLPTPETIVMARINKITDYGVEVSIINYNNINGFIAVNELSRKKIRSIRSILKVGEIKPLLVIRVEHKNGNINIDLSNKQVINMNDEINRLERYYKLINIVHTWLKSIKSYNFKDSNIDNISYTLNDWSVINEYLLWSKNLEEIYESFMDIKIKKRNFNDTFSTLIQLINDNRLNTDMKISLNDIDNLNILIDKYINYDININIKLNLICWSINSLDNIKNIIQDFINIPESYKIDDEKQLNYTSIILNSPDYEFLIKSSNRKLIDSIFPDGSEISDTQLGEIIINILNKYKNIKYNLLIDRKDVL